MDYQLYVIFAPFAFLAQVYLILQVWRNRQTPGVPYLIALCACVIGWLLFNTLELVDVLDARKILWAKVTYLFIVSAPVILLGFALVYSHVPKWASWPHYALLWIVPAFSLLANWSNDLHHEFWKTVTITPGGPFLAVRVTYGYLFWIFWIYAYLLLLISAYFLSRASLQSLNLYRWQSFWVLAGIGVVMFFNAIYVTRVFPWLQKDYSAIAMAIAALFFYIGISRYRFIDLRPLGRSALFECLSDSVLLINEKDLVIDVNEAARRLLNRSNEELIGRPVQEILASYSSSLEHFLPEERISTDICLGEQPPTYFHLRISPIFNQQGQLRGRLIQLEDATERKLIEIKEKEQRQLAEALRDTAAVVNSTLDLDQVLGRILGNLEKVTFFESANIMLIDGNVATLVRFQYHPDRPQHSSLYKKQFKVDEIYGIQEIVRTHQPCVIPEVDRYPQWVKVEGSEWIKSYVGVPIISGDEVVGIINLDSSVPGFFNQSHAERVQAFADQVAIAVQNARLYARLQELARTDTLTGLYNRGYFFTLAEREVERARRYKTPLSLILIDLDHFKEINDHFGHQTGDLALQVISGVCQKIVREVDIVGRYGGEEIMVLLPETGLNAALVTAERLRQQIAFLTIESKPADNQVSIQVTASLGVAELNDSCTTLELLIERADKALYQAKQEGRNYVRAFQV
jgi:diguanylate cyclase (GGDEF)-like protein/PAS domain S-box-containing protein